MTPPPWRLVTPRLNSSIVFQAARQVLVPSVSVYWSGCVIPMLDSLLADDLGRPQEGLRRLAAERQAVGLLGARRRGARRPGQRPRPRALFPPAGDPPPSRAIGISAVGPSHPCEWTSRAPHARPPGPGVKRRRWGLRCAVHSGPREAPVRRRSRWRSSLALVAARADAQTLPLRTEPAVTAPGRHARPRDGHGRDRRRAELRHRGRADALGRTAPPPRVLPRGERGARRRVGGAGRRRR